MSEPAKPIATFEVEGDAALQVVHVRGEVDLSNSNGLSLAIGDAEGRSKDLVIDLTQTSFIDSSAVSALISGYKHSHKRGGDYSLVCPDENSIVHRVLSLMGLDDLMKIYSSVDEARHS